MDLNSKSVLIISPESWGKSKVSKHHYALAFANNGYTVYFLNITIGNKTAKDQVCSEHENIILTYINISTLTDKLRFHYRPLYNTIMAKVVKKWTKSHPEIDYLVSFDCNGVFTNLALFKASKTIFFPVDQVKNEYIKEYKGFDKLLSISPVILRGFSNKHKQTLLHHGLSSYFTDKNYSYSKVSKIESITYVGNLLIGKILDTPNIIKIIRANPNLTFHFYGAYENKNNNLGASQSDETINFIAFLKASKNCVLHGIVSPKELSDAYTNTDAFLVCYDYNYDKNECSNSHKIMEYLSTGKPIISTRISMYDHMELFSMMDTFDNSEFPNFFKEQLNQWETIATKALYEKRIAFANSNAYANKITTILSLD